MTALILIAAGMAAQDNPIPRSTTVIVQGVKVELKRCEKVATKSISCSLVITNLQADRVISLQAGNSPHSFFVDSGGMEVHANHVQLGSVNGSGNGAPTETVTDTPVRGSVDFGVGDPRATSLAKLSIGLHTDQGFRVEFRKVPLESN